MSKSYMVQLHITRHVTAIVAADDALEARKMAANLEFRHQIDGGIVAWTVVDLNEVHREDDEFDLPSKPQAGGAL